MSYTEYNKRYFKCSEAIIHFELYRVLRNILNEEKSIFPIEYLSVEPQYPIKGEHIVGRKRIDLVIFTREGERKIPFLVIEVKEKTVYGVMPFKLSLIHI